MDKKRLGAIVLAAALGIGTVTAVVVVANNGDDDAATATERQTFGTRPPKDIAQRFVEAVAAFDADAALSQVETGADLSGVIASVGAQDVSGSAPEFRQFVSLLEAQQSELILNSCNELSTADSGTRVLCTFDFHLFGSHELGLGPFGGSSFTFTVADGAIVQASMLWNVDEFSSQMWQPFAEWVSANHPQDAAVMYEDDTYSGASIAEGSVRLWERRTREYLEHMTR